MANFGPLTAEIGSVVWGTPANFNGFAFWLRYCSDVAERKPTKLCTMFGRLLRWYTIAISYIGSVTARHSSSGRHANFAALSRGLTYIRQGGHHVAPFPTF